MARLWKSNGLCSIYVHFIALCSKAGHLTLTVLLSTQKKKMEITQNSRRLDKSQKGKGRLTLPTMAVGVLLLIISPWGRNRLQTYGASSLQDSPWYNKYKAPKKWTNIQMLQIWRNHVAVLPGQWYVQFHFLQ